MVKIRLMRVGKRKQPSYRVVVADSRSPRDGRIIEAIGHYQPRQDPSVVEIDNERALYWLRTGAQASDSVRQLLRISGAWSEFSGEAPLGAPPVARKKATPAASVTVAADTETRAAEAEGDVEGGAEVDTPAEAPPAPEAAATATEGDDDAAQQASEEEPTS
jgi:small subunit ribosomal protein S16